MMVANRGLSSDYDAWAAAGAKSWDWQGVLPFFRKLERDMDYGRSDPEQHGHDGPVPIARIDSRQWGSFTRCIATALEGIGLQDIVDQNCHFTDGYFAPAVTVENDQRVSSARAYLDQSTRARDNLTLWTDTRVQVSVRRVSCATWASTAWPIAQAWARTYGTTAPSGSEHRCTTTRPTTMN